MRNTVLHLPGYRKQKYFDFEEICSCLRMDSFVDVPYYLMLWGPIIPSMLWQQRKESSKLAEVSSSFSVDTRLWGLLPLLLLLLFTGSHKDRLCNVKKCTIHENRMHQRVLQLPFLSPGSSPLACLWAPLLPQVPGFSPPGDSLKGLCPSFCFFGTTFDH